MVLLGLTILIASISYLYYRNSPATWSETWRTLINRLQLGTAIGNTGSDVGKRRDSAPGNVPGITIADADADVDEGKGEDEGKEALGMRATNGGEEMEKQESMKIEDSTQAPPFQITEPAQDTSPKKTIIDGNSMLPSPAPPSKAALDRAAMPPPPPPFIKKPTASQPPRPSSPTTPRANPSSAASSAFQIPSFSLDGASTSTTTSSTSPEPEPEIPSFPAINSAQRTSGGARAAPRPPTLSSPSSLTAPSQPRGPLPNRSPNPLPNRNSTLSAASHSLAPPPTHTTIPLKPSKKVLLPPNHSPLDWARLTTSPTSNLRNLPPFTPLLRVPPSLLKTFTGRKGKDAWTVLGGKVYNITPYLPYHPGGEPELLKCAGRDGTRLFAEVHPWVNWEGMLDACLVGIAVGESELLEGSGVAGLEDMD